MVCSPLWLSTFTFEIMLLRFIRIIACRSRVCSFLLLVCWVVVHYIDAPQFVYPFKWWAFGIFPHIKDYDQAAIKICVGLCIDTCFSFLSVKARNGIADFSGKILPNCFPGWLYHFAFPLQCIRVPVAPVPCQHLLFSFFLLDNLYQCIVVFHCGFNLQFWIVNDFEHFVGSFAICIALLVQTFFPFY